MRNGNLGKIQRTLYIFMGFPAKSELIEASRRRQAENVVLSGNYFYLHWLERSMSCRKKTTIPKVSFCA
jgi:hypothetical protein